MIAIISYPDEDHTQRVIGHLRRAGASFVLVDLADFPVKRPVSLTWSRTEVGGFLVGDPGGEIDFRETRAVWWRRVRGFGLDPALRRPMDRVFSESETSQAVIGFLDSLRCPWINPRTADEAAHRKPLQWTLAQGCGLRVPRTLATTDPARARAFVASLDGARAVFKPFLASVEDWRETRIVEESDLGRLEAVRLAPVIFQEYVEGVDLRVTIIGDKIFAAEIDARDTSYPYDMRMVVGEARVRPVELPEGVAAALLALYAKLGIVYGAADLRRTEDGAYYFLEVNPAGQWIFVEDRTGMPISAEIAAYLVARANEAGERRA